jgi:hypothetical protein
MSSYTAMNTLQHLIYNYTKTNYTYHQVQKIVNTKKIDHVALRFLGQSNTIMNKIIKDYSLQPEVYHFYNYQASARWYKNNSDIPRLFISKYYGDFTPLVKNYSFYKYIEKTNPYLAWTSLFAGHINHIALETNDIEAATEACVKHGILMNYEGGLYKISKDKNLIQTATKAIPIQHTFQNGDTHNVPYTFVELVQRLNNRDGFEQENARRIFTSTDSNSK